MKLPPPARRPVAALCATVLFAIAGSALLSVAQSPPAGEPKDHTMFMGADFSVEWNKEFYPIISVSGASFVIYPPKGKLTQVPMNRANTRLQLRQALKLSENSTTVGHLKVDRVYTAANDPERKMQSMSAMIEHNAERQDNLYRKAGVEYSYSGFLKIAGPDAQYGDGGHGAAAEAAINTAIGNSPQLNSPINDIGTHAVTMENELAQERFDALDVSFDVSSDRPLSAPYMIVIARHHAPESKPGTLRDWIHAEALDPIDGRTQKIHFTAGGLAPGFQLKEVQLHLYNHGEEVATSVSDKKVLLTSTEAFRIMLIDYLGAHKGATVPAVRALGRVNNEARARLSPAERDPVYHVRVARDGRTATVFEDAACSKPAPQAVCELFEPVHFYPALENGKAAESVLPMRLSDL